MLFPSSHWLKSECFFRPNECSLLLNNWIFIFLKQIWIKYYLKKITYILYVLKYSNCVSTFSKARSLQVHVGVLAAPFSHRKEASTCMCSGRGKNWKTFCTLMLSQSDCVTECDFQPHLVMCADSCRWEESGMPSQPPHPQLQRWRESWHDKKKQKTPRASVWMWALKMSACEKATLILRDLHRLLLTNLVVFSWSQTRLCQWNT